MYTVVHLQQQYCPLSLIAVLKHRTLSTPTASVCCLLCVWCCVWQLFSLNCVEEYTEVQANSLVSVQNMLKLSELSEGSLLHNLRLRYGQDEIYVCTHVCHACVCRA